VLFFFTENRSEQWPHKQRHKGSLTPTNCEGLLPTNSVLRPSKLQMKRTSLTILVLTGSISSS
jgi:hypothetical protein